MRTTYNKVTKVIKIIPMSSHFIAFISWILIFIISTLTLNILIIEDEKDSLVNYSNLILKRSFEISQEVRNSLLSERKNFVRNCSTEDIFYLRKLLWSFHYIRDIGRISGGSVKCTATWGNINSTKRLPPSSELTPEGFELWRNLDNIPISGLKTDVMLFKNTVVFIPRFAYRNLTERKENIQAILSTKDYDYIYKTFGLNKPKNINEILNIKDSLINLLPIKGGVIKEITCTKSQQKLCVTSVDRKIGLFQLSHFNFLFSIISMFVFSFLFYILIILMIIRKHSIAYRLKRAIDKKTLHIQYQPKIHLRTGLIVGVEALTRWHDEKYGNISPDVFIEIAEKKNIITKLTKLVFHKTLNDMHDFLINDRKFSISINLSIQDITSTDFHSFIEHTLELYDIHPHQIIFEVTERSTIDNNTLNDSITLFINKGYRVSLDDFGTGYSNLSWLSSLNADEIKIDKMFTQAIGTNSISQSMLKGIFQLLENLDILFVFEGIERQDQEDYILERTHEAVGQGWLYSRPVSAEEIKQLLKLQPFKKLTYSQGNMRVNYLLNSR